MECDGRKRGANDEPLLRERRKGKEERQKERETGREKDKERKTER